MLVQTKTVVSILPYTRYAMEDTGRKPLKFTSLTLARNSPLSNLIPKKRPPWELQTKQTCFRTVLRAIFTHCYLLFISANFISFHAFILFFLPCGASVYLWIYLYTCLNLRDKKHYIPSCKWCLNDTAWCACFCSNFLISSWLAK